MSKTICIKSHTDGIGQSTIAANIAVTFALFEKKTLFINCDPESNRSFQLGKHKQDLNIGLDSFLKGDCSFEEITYESKLEFLSIVTSQNDLLSAELEISQKENCDEIIQSIISRFKDDQYEFIVINCPKNSSLLNICSIAASNWIIFPQENSGEKLDEFLSLLSEIVNIKKKLKSELKVAGLLFNKCDSKELFLNQFPDDKMEDITKMVFSKSIPFDESITEAEKSGEPISLFDIKSNGAQAFMDITYEILNSN